MLRKVLCLAQKEIPEACARLVLATGCMLLAFVFVALLVSDIQATVDGAAPPLVDFLFTLTGLAVLVFLMRQKGRKTVGLPKLLAALGSALCAVSGTTSTPEALTSPLLLLGTVLTLVLVMAS